jgi:hypothetical protein
MTCQMPLRFGFPSGIREIFEAVWPKRAAAATVLVINARANSLDMDLLPPIRLHQ